MKSEIKSTTATVLAGLSVTLALSLMSASVFAQPQGRGGFGIDSRAEERTYHFEDTDEDLPYCLFASSKVSDDTPAPLIISLHGLSVGPEIMCNSTAVDFAEAGGYILAAPMGYNTGGWYGSPVLGGGARGRGAGRGGNNGVAAMTFGGINENSDDHLTMDEVRGFFSNALAGRGGRGGNGADFVATIFDGWDANGDGMVSEQEFDDRPQIGARGGRGAGARGAGGGGFGGGNQPENLAELSEKDVMNVLAMVRAEFNVDPDRIYLTGHSMGGAGTYFLGSKHADIWAAIAPVAPAAFSMQDNAAEYLQPLADAGVPILVVHGDVDEMVPIETSRDGWVPEMDRLGIEHQYIELPGITHGPVVTASQEYIYEFFGRHSK